MHTFLHGALGGGLIGLAATILLLGAGHVMGASGIVSTAITMKAVTPWKIVFLASFIITSFVIFQPLYDTTDRTLNSLSPSAFGIGGVFVGFGTQLGNGCTSGHGICGLARFSRRSLASVCTFMAVGVLTAILTQENTSPLKFISFLHESSESSTIPIYNSIGRVLVMAAAFATFLMPSFASTETTSVGKYAPAAISGSLFASGLFISRMVYPSVVMGFLNVALIPRGDWDATLVFVMGFGLIISFASYQFIESTRVIPMSQQTISCPLMTNEEFSVPSNKVIDVDLIFGAVCFGLGWGISGLCPGPALFLASVGVSWVTFAYWPAFFVGAFLARRYKLVFGKKESMPSTEIKPSSGVGETSVPVAAYGSLENNSPQIDV